MKRVRFPDSEVTPKVPNLKHLVIKAKAHQAPAGGCLGLAWLIYEVPTT